MEVTKCHRSLPISVSCELVTPARVVQSRNASERRASLEKDDSARPTRQPISGKAVIRLGETSKE